MIWLCPSCQNPLYKTDSDWRCEQGHSFDIAKEGYVNLLLANQKNSKQPGDSKAMVSARHAFLQNGYYQPLAERMCEMLQKQLTQTAVNLFDAGCGEGYYLNFCQQQLQSESLSVKASGIDISKFAVQKAAKSRKRAEFSVASCFSVPLANASQDAVIQVFAPSSASEISRILKADGLWLIVSPAAQHLHQLKSMLYQTPQKHGDNDAEASGWHSVDSQLVTFDIHLQHAQDRQHLLLMTPFYWSASEQAKQEISNKLETVTADFQLNLYQKVN